MSAALAERENLDWKMLRDWRIQFRAVERLVAIDRDLNENQRTVALDLTTVLLPRTNRFFAAAVLLTLGPDSKIANAVRDLTPAITEVLAQITARERKYARARKRAEKALGEFRGIADQRR